MIKTICALILLGLIAYTKIRRYIRGKKMKCATCGRKIIERPVKKDVNGEELVFCCEHCAAAYVKKDG